MRLRGGRHLRLRTGAVRALPPDAFSLEPCHVRRRLFVEREAAVGPD